MTKKGRRLLEFVQIRSFGNKVFLWGAKEHWKLILAGCVFGWWGGGGNWEWEWGNWEEWFEGGEMWVNKVFWSFREVETILS